MFNYSVPGRLEAKMYTFFFKACSEKKFNRVNGTQAYSLARLLRVVGLAHTLDILSCEMGDKHFFRSTAYLVDRVQAQVVAQHFIE